MMKAISKPCGINTLANDTPVVKATLYGSKNDVAKLKKRILCASRNLGFAWKFTLETDLLKAVDVGITQLPSLGINGQILVQGLLPTEQIETLLKTYSSLMSIEY